MLNKIIRFFLEQKLVTVLLLLIIVGWGIATAPFNWDTGAFPRDPVPVDAIPDIGENQQIVYTEWMGRSPQDVEDQITYPLTTSLLGLPGVESIRSSSMFGISYIYIIFEEDVEFYWSRSRVLEKLNALPADLLPEGVQPQLGPDATALGQVFWYTLEGRDREGNPAGGWDLHELRTIQDYYVRNALAGVKGVSEVASVGGHVKEYQVDMDPVAMKSHNVTLADISEAVRKSNIDVSAGTIELNKVEYYVRGLGYVEDVKDIEEAVVSVDDNVPIRIGDVAKVNIGPQPRTMSGILDKEGAEAVGGIVTARYGDNPLEVIENVKDKIEEISVGLPEKTLDDGTVSKVTIEPFYDRTGLIYETLGTLYEAITLQILITIVVIVVMVFNLRASFLISALLPMAVLMCFIFMKYAGVDANIVALSGIAISIGTMVDLGIILNENILRHMKEAPPGQSTLNTIFTAAREVSSAILTAVSTTIVSFLPVFTLEAAEGRLFGPLAYTKTFALISAFIFTIIIMPAFAHWLFSSRSPRVNISRYLNYILAAGGVVVALHGYIWAGVVLAAFGVHNSLQYHFSGMINTYREKITVAISLLAVAWLLAGEWVPLGVDRSIATNLLFIGLVIFAVLGIFSLFIRYYHLILSWCLQNKVKFLLLPAVLLLTGLNIWLGFERVFGFVAKTGDVAGVEVRESSPWNFFSRNFPGLGREFMPSLDEGSFLLMPTSMSHTGVEENRRILQELDKLVAAIPEVETVVGKAGRAETPLDPAPMTMFENIIKYKSEYKTDVDGNRIRFKVDGEGSFERDEQGELIPDRGGRYYRQWRDHIESPDDIWREIAEAASVPGVTSAPKLQPIETRLVMLQTGMRAPIGVKVFGPDLETIQDFGIELERHLKDVPSVDERSVFADRIVGQPYLEIDINRRETARYGINIEDVQNYIETAVGGKRLTTTVEGRERFPVRARYARERRDDPERISSVLVSTAGGSYVPLGQLADIDYRKGPSMIRSEEGFLVGYVLLDKAEGYAEVTAVEDARDHLQELIDQGRLTVPEGVSYHFAGNYEQQVRAEQRLMLVIPLSLVIIFLILYFQFRSTATAFMIFSAIAMAFAGGFIMIWLYGQDWFMDFSLFGTNMRDLFQMGTLNLSVAVWVGFIALFGIATDDGVVMGTYLKQSFKRHAPSTVKEVRNAVMEAGKRRVRPCLMTTGTTLLALMPVLTSTGRGADVMIPMAIPAFGGMTVAVVTVLIIPVLYSMWAERNVSK